MRSGASLRKVRVRYLGIIQRIVGRSEEEMEITPGAKVSDLLQILKKKYGEEMKNALEDNHMLAANAMILIDGRNAETIQGLDTPLEHAQDVQIVVMVPSSFGG